MRTQNKILILFILIISFSCVKEKKLLRIMEGEWTLERIEYAGIAHDTTLFISETFLDFKKCSKGDNNSGGVCNLIYTSKNNPFNFIYQVGAGSKNTDHITIQNSTDNDKYNQSYIDAKLMLLDSNQSGLFYMPDSKTDNMVLNGVLDSYLIFGKEYSKKTLYLVKK